MTATPLGRGGGGVGGGGRDSGHVGDRVDPGRRLRLVATRGERKESTNRN